MIQYELRPAKGNDVMAIHATLVANISEVSLFQQSVKDIEKNIDSFIVAEYQDDMIGSVALQRYTSDLAEIRGLSVINAYQNIGVGSALVKKCIEQAKSENIKDLWLSTTKPAYYERFGFRMNSKWKLPLWVLLCKVRLVFQQPTARWLPSFFGRHAFMTLDRE